MPEAAVFLQLRCLHLRCEVLRQPRCSVGVGLDDVERMETAVGYVTYAAASCRKRHTVEARFTDDPNRVIFVPPWRWWRRLLFSKGGIWHAT